MKRIYYDAEFTGLHRGTTFISMALISESNSYFYAEFNDYDKKQVNDWIQEHVIDNLLYDHDCLIKTISDTNHVNIEMRGSSDEIKKALTRWLRNETKKLDTEQVRIFCDCYAYDWMLLVDLIAGDALKMPKFINYIPMDLSTSLSDNKFDPDVSREKFAGIDVNNISDLDISLPNAATAKHNCLFDTYVAKKCFEKLDSTVLFKATSLHPGAWRNE